MIVRRLSQHLEHAALANCNREGSPLRGLAREINMHEAGLRMIECDPGTPGSASHNSRDGMCAKVTWSANAAASVGHAEPESLASALAVPIPAARSLSASCLRGGTAAEGLEAKIVLSSRIVSSACPKRCSTNRPPLPIQSCASAFVSSISTALARLC
eukprot:7380606-Prymnesium_polylepis.2